MQFTFQILLYICKQNYNALVGILLKESNQNTRKAHNHDAADNEIDARSCNQAKKRML